MNISKSDVGFHDSSIVEITQVHRSIKLLLEGASMGESTYWMTATVRGVDRITCDGVPIGQLRMETDHGSILDLETEENFVTLSVFWHRYSPHSKNVRIYKISGKELGLDLELGALIEGPG